MLITWVRGFDQRRLVTEVHRENSDELVQAEAAETTQQGRPNPETGSWPAEERIRHVLLPLSQHNGTSVHRGGNFRFERGRRKLDETRRHHRLLESSTCDWWKRALAPLWWAVPNDKHLA